MKKITMASFALMVMISNAKAANQNPVEYWSGFYLGTHFGAGSGAMNESFSDRSSEVVVTPNNPADPFSPLRSTYTLISGSGSRNGDASGSNLDFFAGYNIHPQASEYVIGGQVEGTALSTITMKAYGKRTVSTHTKTFISGNALPPTETMRAGFNQSETSNNLTSTFSFIGRAGLLVKPNLLFYGLIGATEGHFVNIDSGNTASTTSNVASNITGNSRNAWHLGLNAGAGVELKLTDHWSLLGEYRYLRFRFDSNGAVATNSTAVNQITNTQTGSNSYSSSQFTHSCFNFSSGQMGVVYQI